MATTSGLGTTANYYYDNGVKTPAFGSAYDRLQAAAAGVTPNNTSSATAPSSLDYYLKLLAGGNPIAKAPAAPVINVGGGAPAGTFPGGPATGAPSLTTPSGGQPYSPGGLGAASVTQPAGTAPLSPSNDVTAQALRDIQGFLSGNPDTNEVDTNSAEQAAALGIAGSGTGAAEASRQRQSYIDARQVQAIKLLDPYLQRQTDVWTTVEKGRQAADVLRVEEEGKNKRLTEEERSKLIQLAQQGANALQVAQLNAQTQLATNQNTQFGENARATLAANTSRSNNAVDSDAKRYEAQLKYGTSPAGQAAIDKILNGGGNSSGSSYYQPPDQSAAGQSATAREDAVKAAERQRQQDVWDNWNYDPLNPEGYDWSAEYE